MSASKGKVLIVLTSATPTMADGSKSGYFWSEPRTHPHSRVHPTLFSRHPIASHYWLSDLLTMSHSVVGHGVQV